jgi:hypothetical protein
MPLSRSKILRVFFLFFFCLVFKFFCCSDAERVIANPPEIHLDGRRLWIERFVKGRKAQERWSKEKKKPLKLVQAAPAAVTPAPAAVVSVVPSPRREERRALRQVGATSLQQTIAAIAVDGVPMLVALAPASVAKDERTAEEREQEERERRVIEEQQQYARQQHEAAVRAQAALLAPPSVAAQRGQFCVGCGESNLSGFSFCNFCGLASGGVPKQIALAPASVPAVAAPHSVVAAPPSVAAATSVPKSAVTGKFEMDLKQMLEAVNLGMYGPELEKEGIRSAKALQDSKVVAGMKPFHKVGVFFCLSRFFC